MKPLRKVMLIGAVLLLAACGDETYPIPAAEATAMLTSLGQSPTVDPLPPAMSDVKVEFQSLPDSQSVQWLFTRDGSDLGKIVATVVPDGAAASRVKVAFGDPLTKPSSAAQPYSDQIRGNIRQLIVEAVDSTLDRRPFDMDLRARVNANIVSALVGTMFQEAADKMDRAAKDFDSNYGYDTGRETGPPPDPRAATQPTTDLSKFR